MVVSGYDDYGSHDFDYTIMVSLCDASCDITDVLWLCDTEDECNAIK